MRSWQSPSTPHQNRSLLHKFRSINGFKQPGRIHPDGQPGNRSFGPGFGDRIVLALAIAVLAAVGFLLYSQFLDYKYESLEHFQDLIRAKLWSLSWLLIAGLGVYLLRRRSIAPLAAVFAVSAYFVIQYGYLFRGTEYGMNGHWGDNGNRLAEICKMMAYGSFFQDWYLKDLPSFYPPGWFALMAVYAKVLGIEAYQTVKWGYLLIFLVYPWLLYFSWRKILSPVASAAVVVAVLFLAHKYMNWVYYESITGGLFIPWWLYYVERVMHEEPGSRPFSRTEYITGSLIGGALFMIYYYWFFIAAVVTPVIVATEYASTRSVRQTWNAMRHRLMIAGGVAMVSAVYWVPLLRVIRRYGSESAQHLWFHGRHLDLMHEWSAVSLEAPLILIGIFCAFSLWRTAGMHKVIYFYLGCALVLVLDRLANMFDLSYQSRKVLEFVHVFAILPIAIAVVHFWRHLRGHEDIRRGVLGIGAVLLIIAVNGHTQLDENFYQKAVDMRVPSADLAPFQAVNTAGAVFLTQNYVESVYLPYYLFIPLNNMTSHTAGRYSQRAFFIKQASKIADPEALAYLLKYNRFSSVDYLYLPLDTATGKVKIDLYQVGFNKQSTPVHFVFQANIASAPEYFKLRHGRGMYEVAAPQRSAAMDRTIESRYRDIFWCLDPYTAVQ